MSSPPLREKLLSLLAKEIEGYLPQFELYSSDFQMVTYACMDFEEWLKCKWNLSNRQGIYERLEKILEKDPETFRSLLICWAGLWLEKWRDRVKVLSTKPKPPQGVIKQIKEARNILRNMEHRKELKTLLVQKLIRHGEICMPRFIVDQLIIEEIAKHIKGTSEPSESTIILPFDILNSLSQRISQLSKEKGPLVYLNMKPSTP
jgi:hypothetical protein